MAAGPHDARPLATALRLLKPLAAVALLLALLLGTVGGVLFWLLRTEDGTRWLVTRIPHVHAEGLRGAPFGERIEADLLRVSWADGKASVTITGLVGEGMRWQWQPDARTWLGVDFSRLAARRVVVDSGPPSGRPATLPSSLALPLRIAAAAVSADEVVVDRVAPFRHVSGRAAISDAGWHHAEGVSADWDRLHWQGDARIASTTPFAIAGHIEGGPSEGDFAATLRAGGRLERIELDATLRSKPQPDRPPPSVDLHSVVLPYAAWPFAELSARTEALDLSALASAAPQTRLTGQAEVRRVDAGAPISAAVQFDNMLPGRWNERRLPLRRIVLELQQPAGERDRVEFKAFDLLLGSDGRAAGRWHGQGQWKGDTLELETRLDDVQPQQLDGRAAPMSLSGPLAFTLHGLPAPAAGAGAPRPPWSLALRSTLDGRLAAAPQPVRLEFEASADERRLELRRLRASSGTAVAQGQLVAQRAASGAWQVQSSGTLADFDPLPWWPGEPGSAWRQGLHRLNANWQADLQVPAGAARLAPLALAQRLAGSGSLNLHDSVIAGVPLALDLTLGHSPATAGTPSTLRGELRLGGNRFVIDGLGDPAGDGHADRLEIEVDAPALGALAPLFRLDGALARWAPKSGGIRGAFASAGRWPQLRTEGRAELAKLEAGELGIVKGSTDWQLDFQGDGERPLQLKAELGGLRFGRQRAEQLRAELRGTLASHQLQVSGALPLAPPPLAEQLFGVRALAGTRAQLQAEGSWQRQPDGGRWRGKISRLAVGAWDGVSIAGETSAGWVDARDLSAEVGFDNEGNLDRVVAAPGRLRFADAVALRWDEVDIDLRPGGANRIALRAEIEPFSVAPLLARAQPSMGWRGDLRLAGSIELRAAERFDADIVFERRDGDLQVSDDSGNQTPLGLTDLRFGLAAHDGTWFFTQGLAGRTMGEIAGALRVITTAERRWPTADAPVDGVIEARVANLGIWGTWVPPGWRLAGELRTTAAVSGTFGAPEYTGAISGHEIGVRNLLQGVNVSQGEVSIKLEGAGAKIERFTLKAGEGTLTLAGGAEFGSAPNAQLTLDAEHFRVLGRVDRLLVVSGHAEMGLRLDQVKLDGRFGVDEGLFDASRGDAPSLDDDVTVRRVGDAERPAEAAAAPKAKREVAVAVDVDLGQNLRVRGRGLDAELRGQLRITTPNGRLAINGTVNAEHGTYAAYAQKLDIERGNVAFSGPPDNPRLDILALRSNIDTRVGVQISGNLLTPRVKLYSETDMSDTDKLSWLMLGRASDGLGRSDTLLLQRTAVALLAGEGEAPTDALIHALGLDEISFKQSDTDVRETVVSLGKQLSRRWYVGYERGVNATTGTFQLIYRIAQRFTLRAQSGSENSLDVIWTWKFDDVPVPGPMRKSTATPP